MNKQITSENEFNQVIKEHAIILFSASWCPSCKIFDPIFAKFSQQNSTLKTYYFDTDQLSELARKENILSIPTVRVYKTGKVVAQLNDFSMEGLTKLIEQK